MAIRAARAAALYDIHGNLPALDAVLAEIDALDVELIVVGGDIASGPLPRETLAALRLRSEARFIRGNADRELAVGAPPPESEAALAAWEWTTNHLDDDQRTWLAGLEFSLTAEVEDLGSVLFCHGSPRSDEEIITRLSPTERLGPILEHVDEDVIVCGHTHVQFDRSVGGKRVVNSGSVGMPYEDEPGAYWMLITDEIEFRRTEYDLGEAAALIAATGFPESEELIEMLKRPPPPDETSAFFENMAAENARD